MVKAIENGLFSETLAKRLIELEEQKKGLNEAIEAENVRMSLYEDEHSMQAYWEKFLHADLDNPETRDAVMEYFVERVVLYDTKVVLMSKFADDLPYEVDWSELFEENADPFLLFYGFETDLPTLFFTN
ncbi:hypothetical protein LQE92_07515 [Lacrimispora sp. NSJ-141]|uniref:Uncharacterized protein n=1 Tax=Lientehia hominis TaxID=2897778 RepID=A0AAP2W7J0_9FIRM|nr:hypothetical protein [Lientehia hominis]MCD2492478.1 hypothetical protein [Lientehia hominis]